MSSTPPLWGELQRSPGFDLARLRGRTVKQEMRENLLARLRAGRPIFPGIVGYDDTVLPQLTNAILSTQNFILLGLRGQAKSRILRQLAGLLDPLLPAIAGCEIHDNPAAPLCARCRALAAAEGDLPLVWLTPAERYVEKLATPDVTMADLIGDLDPIKAARAGHGLDNELTIHYGLLPRANRGIFAVNELPDLAGKIQVGLFNILQEGDVQIKGYPVRLPLDLAVVFSANPEDYTARGKIVTPLKDRIGSEIRTHYPQTLAEAVAITRQEARLPPPAPDSGRELVMPEFVREVIEAIAFAAREDKRVDQRSGVSQRLPIACLELTAANAERRSLLRGPGGEHTGDHRGEHRGDRPGDQPIVARILDVHAALPALTGKLELEYEGELRGGDTVAAELVAKAIGRIFAQYFPAHATSPELQAVVQWFDLGGSLQLSEDGGTAENLAQIRQIQGLEEQCRALNLGHRPPPALRLAAAEFVLEGLCAHKRIRRGKERGYHAESPARTEAAHGQPGPQIRRRPLN